MTNHTPDTNFTRLDEERRRARNALYALGRQIRPHVRSVIDRMNDETTITLATGTTYRVARLGWTGIDKHRNVRPAPNHVRVLLRNGKALNNERHTFTIDNTTYRIASTYLDADGKTVTLADERELEAFVNELTGIIMHITVIEAQRTQHIHDVAARLPALPTPT